jgi:polyisoprenoid-binding protein YceI
MKHLFILLSLFIFQQSLAGESFILGSSKVQYMVDHPSHDSVGVSEQSKGKISCDDQKKCQYLVAVPVKSFDSGSAGRDQHMLQVTKAAEFPLVQISGEFTMPTEAGSLNLNAKVSLAGKEKAYQTLPIKLTKDKSNWTVHGEWSLKLSDFSIERPELLLIPVKDEFRIKFEQTWLKN